MPTFHRGAKLLVGVHRFKNNYHLYTEIYARAFLFTATHSAAFNKLLVLIKKEGMILTRLKLKHNIYFNVDSKHELDL